MVCVFLSFMLGEDRVIKEFGLSLASAVFLDALVVRCLLLPATLHLLGAQHLEAARVAARLLPRLNIEGDAARHDGGRTEGHGGGGRGRARGAARGAPRERRSESNRAGGGAAPPLRVGALGARPRPRGRAGLRRSPRRCSCSSPAGESELGGIPGLSVGIMSAGQGQLLHRPAALDISQGARIASSAYPRDARRSCPRPLGAGGHDRGWPRRAAAPGAAPQLLRPGLLAQRGPRAARDTRRSPASGYPDAARGRRRRRAGGGRLARGARQPAGAGAPPAASRAAGRGGPARRCAQGVADLGSACRRARRRGAAARRAAGRRSADRARSCGAPPPGCRAAAGGSSARRAPPSAG